jgi:hypothetical protein
LKCESRVEYWAESDRLTELALKDKNMAELILKLLSSLTEYAEIGGISLAIIYFNMAKIERFLGKEAESKKLLEKAEKLSHNIIVKRKKIENVF